MEIQSLINTRLLSLIQSDQKSLRISITTSLVAAEIMHQENLTQVTAAEDNVISTIRFLGDQISDSLQRMNERHDSERDSAVRRYEESLAKLTSVLNSMLPKPESLEKTDLILKSLVFAGMDERYDRIEEPCEGTFQWIFEEVISPLPEWLRAGAGLFLISGKAGCGKSTMMKIVFDDPETLCLLEQWAGTNGKPLITAQFFFWNSGSSLQKTHDGLLRSLLLQVLSYCPDLIPLILPGRWKSKRFGLSKTWTRQELSDAIARLSEQDEVEIPCFCFFIDGLDEYQGQMRCLVEDFRRLMKCPYIKICAASRPRNVFDRAFGAKKELVLHEYTGPDMRTFVKTRLVDDPAFKHLVQSNPKAKHIVTAIQDRAEGVFLWVFLVVQDLLRELDDYGTLEELEDRLHTLPPDLFDYFKRIIESIEQPYKQNMARLLLLLVDAGAPIPVMALHFLYQDTKDEGHVLSDDLEVNVPNALETTTAQIKKWCRDLLDVNFPGSSKVKGPEVQFSHQSVRDYIRVPEVEHYLVNLAGQNFHATHTLCRLSLAHLRVALCKCNVVATYEFDQTFQVLLRRVMYFAASYESKTGRTPRELLNRMDEFCTAAMITKHGTWHWSTRVWPRNCVRARDQPSRLEFLEFAAHEGLATFIREEMGLALEYREVAYVLYGALRPHRNFSSLCSAGRLDIIKFLLSSGVNHKAQFAIAPRASVWERFLIELGFCNLEFTPDEFLQVVEMFLDAGADRHVHHGPELMPIESVLPGLLRRHVNVTLKHHDRLCRILSAHGISTDNASQTDP
jgi:hypothetical protein